MGTGEHADDRSLILVVFTRGRVRRLLHAPTIGADATFQRQKISEKLQRNQMYERRQPFRRFRNQQNLLRRQVADSRMAP